MRKIKILLISAAVVTAVSSALAGRINPLCEDYPQYYLSGGSYLPAGRYGVDYICWSTAGVCTYYLPDPSQPSQFWPCRTGAFLKISANKDSR